MTGKILPRAILLGLLLAAPGAMPSGFSVNNGGVIWACTSNDGDPTIRQGVLTDLQEATGFQLELIHDQGGDPMTAYRARKAWLRSNLPELYAELKPRFEYVEAHLAFPDAELIPTADFNLVFKPEAILCPKGHWSPVNIANFREEDQMVLIRKRLWESPNIATIDKAALLFHEAIYYWTRTYFGVTDSDKARRVNGILFSTLSPEEMKALVTQVLGTYPTYGDGKFICVVKNLNSNQVYAAYGASERDASLTAKLRCQNDARPRWCNDEFVECEEILPNTYKHCIGQNLSTLRYYEGNGRNQIEAQFNAHMACFMGTQAIGGRTQHCPDFALMDCE
jgi:hypothetical protein